MRWRGFLPSLAKLRTLRRKTHLLAHPWPSFLLWAVVFLMDQATKQMALYLGGSRITGGFREDIAVRLLGDFLWMFVAYNSGAAFSLNPERLVPFLPTTVFYVLLVAGATWFLLRLWKTRRDPLVRTGVALILGGAYGNLLDRLIYRHVVDFISVGMPGLSWRWPTFNIADCAIVYGVVLMIWGEIRLVRIRDHRAARHVPQAQADQESHPA
ncbi:MAG: signal peptidase II [Fibrobacterota bacterium]|nr:signal peptidase II [Fibrobacterota bacterium]QQS03683.1 MAG: signal peptidase II [Fibrobacterota bacterium]